MKRVFLLLAIQFPVLIATAEIQSHRYTGQIVNARCMQAAQIVSRNSRGYSPSGIAVSALAGNPQNAFRTDRMKKSILQHCSINPGVTEFALLDDSGNFFVLDEPGNRRVAYHQIPTGNDFVVIIEGYVDREILYVRSLKKGSSSVSGAAAPGQSAR